MLKVEALQQLRLHLGRQLVELHVLAQVAQLLRCLLRQRVPQGEEVDDGSKYEGGDVHLDKDHDDADELLLKVVGEIRRELHP